MRALASLLVAVLAAQTAALGEAGGTGSALTSMAAEGDQFERALLEVIAAAAREGKRITVRRMNGDTGEGVIALVPAPRRTPVTSVIAVEIRDRDAGEEPSQRILLKNQGEIMRALNAICEEQLEWGETLSGVATLGGELGQAMRGVSHGVGKVNEVAAATLSEVGDVSETSLDSSRTLRSIRAELKALNQTVQALLSSMGELEAEIGVLGRSIEEGAGDEESGEGGESATEKSSGRGQGGEDCICCEN